MTRTNIRIKLTDARAIVPVQREGDSGADMHSIESITVQPGEIVKCSFGLAIELPLGMEAQIRPRSGLSSQGFTVITGTVDAGYRGTVSAILHNVTRNKEWRVKVGDRVAQMVVGKVEQVTFDTASELSATARNTAGFGSTGVGFDANGSGVE